MREILEAGVLGLAIGSLFGALGFAVPAPGNLAGVAGVAGLTIGFMIAKGIMGNV